MATVATGATGTTSAGAHAGARALALKVITPDRVALDASIESLRVPGLDGSIGILPRHAAMVAALAIGELKYTAGGQERRMFVAGGFAEVRRDAVRVVTPAGELPGEIDEARAKRAEERARERLAAGQLAGGEPLDLARAELSLRRALARLRARQSS